MKSSRKIITGLKSKVYNWDMHYFFVKISEASILNVKRTYRTKWNLDIGRYFDQFVLRCGAKISSSNFFFFFSERHPFGKGFPWDGFLDDVKKLKALGQRKCPDIHEERIRRSLAVLGRCIFFLFVGFAYFSSLSYLAYFDVTQIVGREDAKKWGEQSSNLWGSSNRWGSSNHWGLHLPMSHEYFQPPRINNNWHDLYLYQN